MTPWGLCREGHSIVHAFFQGGSCPALILCNPLPVTRNFFIHPVMTGFKGTGLTIYGSNFFVLLSLILTPPSTQNLQPSFAWILFWVVIEWTAITLLIVFFTWGGHELYTQRYEMQPTASFCFKQFSRYFRKTASNTGVPERDVPNTTLVQWDRHKPLNELFFNPWKMKHVCFI